jgi:hypothetical protein
MVRHCTRSFLPNYFVMTSYHWNAGKTNLCKQCKYSVCSLSTRTFITLKPFCLQTVGDSLSTRTFITLKPFCPGKTNLCKQCKYSVCLTLIHLYYVSRIHGHIMISKEIVSIFVNFISTIVICLKSASIKMLDKLITFIVCWYKTLYRQATFVIFKGKRTKC